MYGGEFSYMFEEFLAFDRYSIAVSVGCFISPEYFIIEEWLD